MEKKKMTALVIMDGYGYAPDGEGNCIGSKGSRYVRYLTENYPSSTLEASGLAVGLPDGQMGNSEVGHLNIGAGRIVYQELTRISKDIDDGEFYKNEALVGAVRNAVEKGKSVHLMGLLSDGGVHSHITHLFALLELCRREGAKKAFVHCFTDGRDVSPTSGAGYMRELQRKISEIGVGKIASVCGRYYAMDRDNRWDRVEKAYDMLTLGKGNICADAAEALEASYNEGVTDEFVLPTPVYENGKPVGVIEDGDSVIFFNFRPDRAREMTRQLTQKDKGFAPGKEVKDLRYVCFTRYDDSFTGIDIAFKPQTLDNTLGEYLASQGKTQLRIAETEKYAHVTFFFNGGVEEPNKGEDRILIPSPKVATYDLQPEMSAYLVAERAVAEIRSGKYDVMILNFANCDMVGHTGVIEATKKAVGVVDECVEKVVSAIREEGGRVFVTADHGNAEKLLDEEGKPFTAHTTNPVPFIYVSDDKDVTLMSGKLCDIAPTMLCAMGLPVPKEMTGKVLISK